MQAYICMHVYIYTHIPTYMHTYIHRQTQAHTHITTDGYVSRAHPGPDGAAAEHRIREPACAQGDSKQGLRIYSAAFRPQVCYSAEDQQETDGRQAADQGA